MYTKRRKMTRKPNCYLESIPPATKAGPQVEKMIIKVYHIRHSSYFIRKIKAKKNFIARNINDVIATGIKFPTPRWQLTAILIDVSRSFSHRSTFVILTTRLFLQRYREPKFVSTLRKFLSNPTKWQFQD